MGVPATSMRHAKMIADKMPKNIRWDGYMMCYEERYRMAESKIRHRMDIHEASDRFMSSA